MARPLVVPSAAQPCVQGGDPGGRNGAFIPRIEQRHRRRQRAVELADAKQRFEIGAGKSHDDVFRLIFAFSREVYGSPGSRSSDGYELD